MSSKKIIILLLVITLAGSCRQNTLQHDPSLMNASLADASITQVPEELETNCYICHNPKAKSHDAIIAPPLAVVKMRYNRQFNSRKQFVDAMTSFMLSPTKEKAIMYGAVSRFGLMPVTPFDEKTTRRIVEYLYANSLEEPSWLKDEMKRGGMNP
jgi:hypothetical protein